MLISYLKLISNSKVMIFVNTIDEVQYLDFLLSHIKFRNSNGQNTEERIENRKIFKRNYTKSTKLTIIFAVEANDLLLDNSITGSIT